MRFRCFCNGRGNRAYPAARPRQPIGGALRFVRPDRACALASEANDWNLARRAWQAGVRFTFVERETSTLHVHPRWEVISAQYHELGLPLSAVAAP